MRQEVVLVTGAAGELGQALIERWSEEGRGDILALDVRALPEHTRALCRSALVGDLLDARLLARLVSEYAIPLVYHLAALLSTRAEFTPEEAHRVNVDGTLALLRLATEQSTWLGRPVTFMFPSSVAVYGLPDLDTKARAGAVREHEWNAPTTMYGCNKLYCEQLGRYYARHYRQLAAASGPGSLDFRCIRFPGLISASTLPSGGTSDYAPEMIHAAAQGRPNACFVRPDTRMPFLAMPDAIRALLMLERAPRERLASQVYNVTGFSLTAEQILDRVRGAFTTARVSFEPDPRRQAIVDSWPVDQDDALARREWGWTPEYDAERAFRDYLIPGIRSRYE
jgi:nucleoside-diphosphate-sugar epimerase